MKNNAINPVRNEIEKIRVRLANRFLITAAILAPLTLVVSFIRAITTVWDPVFALHVAMTLCICVMAFMREHIHHRVKAVVIVGVLLTAGVIGAVQNGLIAPALFYLVVGPAFASMLFGRRGSRITFGIVVLAVVCVAIFTVTSGHLPAGDIRHYMTSPIAWIMELVILILVLILIQVAAEMYIGSLVKSLAATHRHEVHLNAHNEMLEKATDALRRSHDETIASLNENAAMVRRLDQVIRQTIDAFATATVHTDPYTEGHEKRVADLSLTLGRKLKFSDDQLMGLELAAKAHDVGQLKVPSEILLRPHGLTPLEFKFIQQHSEAGWEILSTIDFPWPVAEIVRQHHENFDGTGYPSGLAGEAILLEARIIRAADLVEALSSHRPFRPARSREEVIQQLTSERGRALDPQIADFCLELLAEGYAFPAVSNSTVRAAA